jgi:hypothetical protein
MEKKLQSEEFKLFVEKFFPSSSLSGVSILILLHIVANGVIDTGKFATTQAALVGKFAVSLIPVANLTPV